MRFVNIKESSDSRGNNPAFDEKKQLYVPKESGNFLFVELNCLFWLRRTIKEVICKVSLGMADSPGSLQEITVFFCLLFPIFFVFLHTSAWMFLRPGISEKPSAPLVSTVISHLPHWGWLSAGIIQKAMKRRDFDSF